MSNWFTNMMAQLDPTYSKSFMGKYTPTGWLLTGGKGFKNGINEVKGVYESLSGASAAKDAAKMQENAINEAQGYANEAYDKAGTFLDPYYQYGMQDYTNIRDMIRGGQFDVAPQEFQYGQFNERYTTPDYNAQSYQMPASYNAPSSPNYGNAPSAYQDNGFNFQADPGYQFRLEQGANAINTNAAAKGNGLSGSTLKALAKFGQNLASDEFSNAYGRYQDQRNFGYGQNRDAMNDWQNQRNFARGAFESDRGFGRSSYENDRNFGRGAFESDRTFGRGSYENDRNFGYNAYRDRRDDYTNDRNFGYQNFTDSYGRRANEMTNRYNRYAGLGNLGYNAANDMSNLYQNRGTTLGNLAIQRGNVQAAGRIAPGNANRQFFTDLVDTGSNAASKLIPLFGQ